MTKKQDNQKAKKKKKSTYAKKEFNFCRNLINEN